ncbi:MAG: sensor histidine kinase [Lachnospiraceae bacterium]|nr:sensor histidine kinase [Lachnospiraceae bacterium]MDD3616690.1 sensor histidine kinase [Lachnospiraceae bacterium]
MNQLFSKILLIAYSLSLVLFVQADLPFIVSLLIVLFLTTTIYFFNHKQYSRMSTLIFSIAAFFFPPLYYYSPVLGYDMVLYQNYPALVLLLLGYFFRFFQIKNTILWILILGIMFSCYLAHSERTYTKLHQLFKKTRDDSTELNLLLEEKNKHLLEKQDYEIYNATLKERNRIAREIHDNVGHMLSRAILLVGAIRTINKDDNLSTSLGTLSDTLDTAMNNIRTSVHDLHDEAVNLEDVISNLVHAFSFCPIDLNYDMGKIVPREVKYCFIAILKEALSNIERHSNASHVSVLSREHPGFYQLMIHDNGTKKGDLYGNGIGLSNMRDRVDSLGGNIQITQNSGFRIYITLPKTASPE